MIIIFMFMKCWNELFTIMIIFGSSILYIAILFDGPGNVDDDDCCNDKVGSGEEEEAQAAICIAIFVNASTRFS